MIIRAYLSHFALLGGPEVIVAGFLHREFYFRPGLWLSSFYVVCSLIKLIS